MSFKHTTVAACISTIQMQMRCLFCIVCESLQFGGYKQYTLVKLCIIVCIDVATRLQLYSTRWMCELKLIIDRYFLDSNMFAYMLLKDMYLLSCSKLLC